MNADKYKEFLLNNIKPFAHPASGNKEVVCRCFYCSDSKDQTKGHFYIKIPLDDNPSTYYCQKCHASGLVNLNKLLEWGLYDNDMASELTSYNKRIMKLEKNRKFKESIVYNITNNTISQDKLSEFKLRYINNRLGINIDFKECLDKKIVLNIKDLLSTNRLGYTRHSNIIDQLDANFLGFLSYDNAFLNMRNLDIGEVYEGINKRYVNYNLFNKYDNTLRFYTMPNNINLLDPRPIKLHIAEGPFDILSIYYNLRKDLDNNIYTAIGGSGYKGIIRFFITSLKLINLELHVYADNDIDRYKIVDIVQIISPFNIPLYLHRNIYPDEKDFGVKISNITETIERII